MAHHIYLYTKALHTDSRTFLKDLKTLVNLILKSYGPAVFEIVANPGLEYGSYHFYNYMKR